MNITPGTRIGSYTVVDSLGAGGMGNIDYPVWSPDGKWLLFDRFRPEGGDIWIAEDLE